VVNWRPQLQETGSEILQKLWNNKMHIIIMIVEKGENWGENGGKNTAE